MCAADRHARRQKAQAQTRALGRVEVRSGGKLLGVTLESIKMSRDFGTELKGLYPFNHGIFCKKSKVHSIFDLAKKEFSGSNLN